MLTDLNSKFFWRSAAILYFCYRMMLARIADVSWAFWEITFRPWHDSSYLGPNRVAMDFQFKIMTTKFAIVHDSEVEKWISGSGWYVYFKFGWVRSTQVSVSHYEVLVQVDVGQAELLRSQVSCVENPLSGSGLLLQEERNIDQNFFVPKLHVSCYETDGVPMIRELQHVSL